MTRYKLISGTHYERNPLEDTLEGGRHHPDRLIKYEAKGKNIIESERALDKIYPNKFEKVTERDDPPKEVTEGRRDDVDDLLSAPGSTWKEDDRKFLEGLSDKDFARVMRTIPQGVEPGEEPDKDKATDRKHTKLGEDVTDKFQRAYDHGFKVYRNPAGKHQVTKAGRGGGRVLNESPLSEEQVDPFLIEYTREE